MSTTSVRTGQVTDFDGATLPVAELVSKTSVYATLEVSESTVVNPPVSSLPEEIVVPQDGNGRNEVDAYDTFSVFSVVKTVAVFLGIFSLYKNEFYAGFATALIGESVGTVIQMFSGRRVAGTWFANVLNAIFSTRFGWKSSEIEKDEDLGPHIGGKTLFTCAEVLRQTYSFYPLMIMFVKFGFQEDSDEPLPFNFFSFTLFGGLILFFHILCWTIAPSKNVAHGYIYFSTFFSYSSCFILLLTLDHMLADVSLRVTLIDTFYTRDKIYAWTRFGVMLFFGFTSLAQYRATQEEMTHNPQFPLRLSSTQLEFQQSVGYLFLVFDLASFTVFRVSREAFFFDFEDVDNELVGITLIDGVIVTNCAFSAWLVIMAKIESWSFETHMHQRKSRIQGAQNNV